MICPTTPTALVAGEFAIRAAAPSRRGDRSAGPPAGCRCRASRGSACRCPCVSSTANSRAVLLHLTRQRVEKAGPGVSADPLPRRQRRARRRHRGIHVLRAALRHARQHPRRGGIDRVERRALAASSTSPPMNWPNARPWPSSHFAAAASLSGAGPYSIVSKIAEMLAIGSLVLRSTDLLTYRPTPSAAGTPRRSARSGTCSSCRSMSVSRR